MARPTEEQLRGRTAPADQELADLCQVLGNPVRIQILRILLGVGQGCFCGDLVKMIGLAQSTISHHLKALRDAGLVTGEGNGAAVCYCVDRQRLRTVSRLVWELSILHEEEEST